MLERLLGSTWQARIRRLSRVRWVTKYRVLRRGRIRLRDDLRQHLAYLAWDPEIESFTFDIDNRTELAEFVATLTGKPADQVARWVGEPAVEPWFNERWANQVRWRFDVKRRLRPGHRYVAWALVRAIKPRLVVETGVYQGIGSVILLAALARNEADGCPGKLLSIDIDPTTGYVVPSELQAPWKLVHGSTIDVLENLLAGAKVDILFHDSADPMQYHEFITALDHAADRIFLVCGGIWGDEISVLQSVCRERGGRYFEFQVLPRNHFFVPGRIGVGVFP